ncbi:MAG: 16S rRNA (uracil(1498)-N(3))-methyltransferase [Tuberibacillus sp.]
MQRYFVADHQVQNDEVQIEGEDARHIVKVMRMQPGDAIICCTYSGEAFNCTIKSMDTETVTASIMKGLETSNELPVRVAIAQGLPKGDKLDFIVQKGTELGADSFFLFQAERSIAKWIGSSKIERKLERLQKIAKEASEQSHRNKIPAVSEPVSIIKLIEMSEPFQYKVVAYEEDAKSGDMSGLYSVFQRMSPGDSLFAVIGPEGGLTEEEVSALKSAGFGRCALGKRILRTETAPLYLLSAVSYYFELENGVK